MVEHFPSGVFSERGRCWHMVYDAEGSGRPTFCTEPVIWQGRYKLSGDHGKWIQVWSCESHREGLEGPGQVYEPAGR